MCQYWVLDYIYQLTPGRRILYIMTTLDWSCLATCMLCHCDKTCLLVSWTIYECMPKISSLESWWRSMPMWSLLWLVNIDFMRVMWSRIWRNGMKRGLTYSKLQHKAVKYVFLQKSIQKVLQWFFKLRIKNALP